MEFAGSIPPLSKVFQGWYLLAALFGFLFSSARTLHVLFSGSDFGRNGVEPSSLGEKGSEPMRPFNGFPDDATGSRWGKLTKFLEFPIW